jgi:four helix bundle protein
MKENIIREKSSDFALDIIKLYQELTECKEFVLPKQLLRSGTSIGANVEEASAAISRKDFISKISIASKEAGETRYWLLLLQKSQLVKVECSQCLNEVEQLINILTAIVKTSQQGND